MRINIGIFIVEKEFNLVKGKQEFTLISHQSGAGFTIPIASSGPWGKWALKIRGQTTNGHSVRATIQTQRSRIFRWELLFGNMINSSDWNLFSEGFG